MTPSPRGACLSFAAAALSATLPSAPSALAQDRTAIPYGTWRVQSGVDIIEDDTCRITGILSISRAPDSQIKCELETQHTCKTLPTSTAKQSCTASIANNAVIIDAQIVSFDSWSTAYCAEDLTLRWRTPDQLTGLLLSCSPALDVVVTRQEDLTS